MQVSNILLFPLKLIFYTGITLKNWCYDVGICSKYTLNIPVISIGNIVFGGTGKTPMVIYLCEKLKQDGYKPAVISRGYKRQSQDLVVVNDGSDMMSEVNSAGDEPYLIATKLNVPVVVSNEKAQAAKYVIANFKDVNVIVIDDGFQYRKLDRTLDIVLLNGLECSGMLREPKSSLKRADIVLTLDKQYSISELSDNNFNTATPNESVYAFCGIANPDSFFNFIQSNNIDIKGQSVFQDHHKYSKESIQDLKSSINKSGVNSIITTEKDLVKLPEEFLKRYKIYIVRVNIIFKDDTFYKNVISCIAN
jgi:tetraacyldisaccharide 4'-kinase